MDIAVVRSLGILFGSYLLFLTQKPKTMNNIPIASTYQMMVTEWDCGDSLSESCAKDIM